VNGKIVPLNHKLESGDAVEIITNKKQLPNKDWLDFVVSTKAKTHIRQYIRQQQREKSISIGRNLFEAECQKHKVALNKILKMEDFEKYLQEKQLKSTDELYSTIAYGKLGARTVVEAVLPADEKQAQDLKPDTNVFKRVFDKFGSRSKNLILVDQQDGVLVTFGKCCNPVRGDSILGFVTRGRGVAIHRKDCARVLNIDPDRRVEVAWNEANDLSSVARIVVIAEDKKGVLADITSVISEHDINIDKVQVKAQQEGMSRLIFDLCVKDANHLRTLMRALESLKFIVGVSRQ
jgi:GTP pyrophosphokinase